VNPKEPAWKNEILFKKPVDRCPLCSSPDTGFLYRITRYRPSFTVDRCGSCGFIFMNPPFTDEGVKNLYCRDYYSGRAEYSYHDEREIKKFSRHVWNRRARVIRRFAPPGNFLDVGASFGGLMESAEQYFTAYGIELSPYAGEHAKLKFGDRVHIGTLDDHPFTGGFFSAITMIELIEHIADPVRAVNTCHGLLRDRGVLVIQTANMAARQAVKLKDRYHYFMPGHLSYFTAENLSSLLKRAGFGNITIFYPVEFGLLPKLLKSRGSFTKPGDYRAWIDITSYHLMSMVHFRNFAMTSSMVIYAIK